MVKPCKPVKYLEPVRKVTDVVQPGTSMSHLFDCLIQAYPPTSLCTVCDKYCMCLFSPTHLGLLAKGIEDLEFDIEMYLSLRIGVLNKT